MSGFHYALAFRLVIAMKYFVRFAKFSLSGSITRPGWRLRLFATSNDASAFALEMVAADWRVELGDFGGLDPEAPRPLMVERSLAARLAQSRKSAWGGPRFGRA